MCIYVCLTLQRTVHLWSNLSKETEVVILCEFLDNKNETTTLLGLTIYTDVQRKEKVNQFI